MENKVKDITAWVANQIKKILCGIENCFTMSATEKALLARVESFDTNEYVSIHSTRMNTGMDSLDKLDWSAPSRHCFD